MCWWSVRLDLTAEATRIRPQRNVPKVHTLTLLADQPLLADRSAAARLSLCVRPPRRLGRPKWLAAASLGGDERLSERRRSPQAGVRVRSPRGPSQPIEQGPI